MQYKNNRNNPQNINYELVHNSKINNHTHKNNTTKTIISKIKLVLMTPFKVIQEILFVAAQKSWQSQESIVILDNNPKLKELILRWGVQPRVDIRED